MAGKYSPYPEYKDSGSALLGDIPEHWQLTRVKYVAELTPKKPVIDRKLDCSFIPMEKLKTDSIVLDETKQIDDVYDGYTYFADGDILMAKVTPCFENKNIAIAKGLTNQIGFGSSEIYTIRASNKVDNRFLYYRLQEDGFMDLAIGAMTGAGGLKRVPSETVANYTYASPEDDEQEKIANFLDHETAKIDTLIEKQQQLIKLLKEKRQAVISHAVSKGLNPNAPMRDSGVEWLGEVPAHWVVARFKHLVSDSAAGPYGSSLTKSMYTTSGIRVYGQQQVIPDDFSIGDYYISEAKFEEMRRYEVFPNDVLISVMGTVGKVAVAPEDIEQGIINPRLVKYKVMADKVLPHFVKASILSDVSQSQLLFAAQGSTMDGLNMQILGELPIPHPPALAEQKEILNEIKRQRDKFENLLKKSQVAVELLAERRAALISAAVTGKIDVRNWVSPEPSNTANNKDAAA